MSVQESQSGMIPPPTGLGVITSNHEYNPAKGTYEPILKNVPLNANIAAAVGGANLIAGILAANPVWIYYITVANAAVAAGAVVLTQPGGTTLTVEVPPNTTIILPSTPNAPIFMSTAAGNIQVFGAATLTVSVSYVVK